MSLHSLNSSDAIGDGTLLWVIPNREVSFWARKIDWYLQFQISKATIHRSKILSDQIKKSLAEIDIDPIENKSDSNSPLMIFSHDQLPNKQTIQLPYDGNVKTWAKSTHRLWVDLGKPTLRIFLPHQVDLKTITAAWPDKNAENVSVVFDVGG